MSSNFSEMTVNELLVAHSNIISELNLRKVLRSNNNPTGDYVEWLVANKLGLCLADNSAKGFDAVDPMGIRYQIKGRRVMDGNPVCHLGVIRDLAGQHFEWLIAVVLDKDWSVLRALKIPGNAVSQVATFREHVNGHVLVMNNRIYAESVVEDITSQLRDK